MKKSGIAHAVGFLVLVCLVLNFAVVGKGAFCSSFSHTRNNAIFLVQQTEEPLEEILPGPSFLEKAASFLYIIYDYIRKAIVFLLEKTIFRENPKLAEFYGDVASFLASLTAIYLLLLLIASAKKIIGVLLVLGWALFVVAIFLRG